LAAPNPQCAGTATAFCSATQGAAWMARPSLAPKWESRGRSIDKLTTLVHQAAGVRYKEGAPLRLSLGTDSAHTDKQGADAGLRCTTRVSCVRRQSRRLRRWTIARGHGSLLPRHHFTTVFDDARGVLFIPRLEVCLFLQRMRLQIELKAPHASSFWPRGLKAPPASSCAFAIGCHGRSGNREPAGVAGEAVRLPEPGVTPCRRVGSGAQGPPDAVRSQPWGSWGRGAARGF
jgi:hypothetical protein